MAKYDTRVLKKGSLTVTISKEAKDGSAGARLEAFLKILAGIAGGNYPSGGPVPPGGGNRPDQGLPGGPPPTGPGSGGGERPDQGLPGKPPGVGQQPGIDNSLPEPPVAPVDPTYPDNTLPEQPPGIDNTLPGFIGDNAAAIAKIILGHCVQCPTATPK